MVHIPNVHMKHNGILADNSTKITLYLPECTDEQHSQLIKLARMKTVAIIILEPEMMMDIQDVISQIGGIADWAPPIKETPKKERDPLEDPLEFATNIMRKGGVYDQGQF